jgi:hypothetical protein
MNTNGVAAVIRLDLDKSTTNCGNLQEQSRKSRNMILNQPGCFSRLRHFAQGRKGKAAYWHGRMVWIYLTSLLWSIQRARILISANRLVYFCASAFVSFQYWLHTDYWMGLTKPHQTRGWLSTQ